MEQECDFKKTVKSQTQETWAERAGCLADPLQFFHMSKNNTSAAYCCSPPSIFDSLIKIRHDDGVILICSCSERERRRNYCFSCLSLVFAFSADINSEIAVKLLQPF